MTGVYFRQQDELALPLYAVIIIAVALVVVLIGITVCVLKIKQKWKRRKSSKMARNRDLLRYAPPPSRTMPPSYLWSTGSQNGAYYIEETENWPRLGKSWVFRRADCVIKLTFTEMFKNDAITTGCTGWTTQWCSQQFIGERSDRGEGNCLSMRTEIV